MCRIALCPECQSHQVTQLGEVQRLISGGVMLPPVKYSCRDCGWYGNLPDYSGEGLLILDSHCHAALVVEYNLWIWGCIRDNPDRLNGETEAQYLRRLDCVTLVPETKLDKDCRRKARQWSDYYR